MFRPRKILLVDDDPDHLFICRRIFEKNGYDVQILLGCNGLLTAVERFKPELIFMDHNMPGICGPEAIQLLRSNPSSASVPIIYFSAEYDLEELASKAGANASLKKPFAINHMLNLTGQYFQ